MELTYLFEAFWIIAFIIAFWHLTKTKSLADAMIFMIPALVWSYFVEFLGMNFWKIYEYPDSYVLGLFGVPIAIACGWATIMHFGYYFTTHYIHVTKRMNVDLDSALISTAIDFIILEPFAFIFKFWVWKQNDFWFGAPLFNFIGWFLIITLYLITYQYISSKYKDKKQQAIYFTIALTIAFIILQIIGWAYLTIFGYWF